VQALRDLRAGELLVELVERGVELRKVAAGDLKAGKLKKLGLEVRLDGDGEPSARPGPSRTQPEASGTTQSDGPRTQRVDTY
jgi:hypothetical protein